MENQLYLIDSKQLEKQTKYSELMNMKRLLKRTLTFSGKVYYFSINE
ncbi:MULTISPECIES: YokU family protein [Peribacillus]